MDFICGCNVSDAGDDDDTAYTISSRINMENIEREGTGTISSIVRAFDTDVSHLNRDNDSDLYKIPKAFIELNSRRMYYFSKALYYFAIIANNGLWCHIIVNGCCYKGS